MSRDYAIIIGAMKCGTTSLYEYLRTHPQVCAAPKVDFFADPEAYGRGFDWYESLFDFEEGVHRIALENSGNYTKHPTFPSPAARIAEHLEVPRFIYMVRDPVDRVISHYNYSLQYRWVEPGQKPTDEVFLIPSRYSMQLEQYERVFPRESILVERLDELAADPRSVLARVQEFLGLEVLELERVDRPHNVTRPLTRYEHLVWRLGLRRFRSIVPEPLRDLARRLVGSAPVGRIELSDQERIDVARRLEDDALDLLERWGVDPRGPDWPLDTTGS